MMIRKLPRVLLTASCLAAAVSALFVGLDALGTSFSLSADCTAITGQVISASKWNNCASGIAAGINAIDNDKVSVGAAISGSKLDLTSGTGRILMSPANFSGSPGTTGSVFNAAAVTFTDSSTAASGTAAAFAAYGIQQPTLAAAATGVTTTSAATWYIAGPPIAGTNETITNPYALWVDSGDSRFDGNIILQDTSAISIRNQSGELRFTMPSGKSAFVGSGSFVQFLEETQVSGGTITSGKLLTNAVAPGAGFGKFYWRNGTTAGTLKLVAISGTSTTEVTIVDNVGAGN